MHLRVRAVLAVVGAVLVLVVFMPPGAQAQEGRSITVTPNTGLDDGQAVTVAGSGFDPDAGRWAGTVCLAEILNLLPSPTQINSLCGATSVVQPTPNATGAFSTTMVVHQVQPNFTGGTIDCRLSGCVVLFIDLSRDVLALSGWAEAEITFGSPTPLSKADCKNGGWRNLANDQGRSFRNQGQCVSYVVAHRR